MPRQRCMTPGWRQSASAPPQKSRKSATQDHRSKSGSKGTTQWACCAEAAAVGCCRQTTPGRQAGTGPSGAHTAGTCWLPCWGLPALLWRTPLSAPTWAACMPCGTACPAMRWPAPGRCCAPEQLTGNLASVCPSQLWWAMLLCPLTAAASSNWLCQQNFSIVPRKAAGISCHPCSARSRQCQIAARLDLRWILGKDDNIQADPPGQSDSVIQRSGECSY